MFAERTFYCHGREIVQKKGGNPLCERFFTFHGNKVHFLAFFGKNFFLLFYLTR